jgi:tetratricopeptide (TPR) repeat protein
MRVALALCAVVVTAFADDAERLQALLKQADGYLAEGDYAAAKETLGQAVVVGRAAGPTALAPVLSRLGDACVGLHDNAGAVQSYKETLGVADPHWSGRLRVATQLALVYQRQDKTETAATLLTDEISASAQTAGEDERGKARLLLGVLLAPQRKWSEAGRVLERALSDTDEHSSVHLSVMAALGQVSMFLGKYVKAEDLLYRYFQSTSKTDDAASQVRLLAVLAELYLRMVSLPDAEHAAREAVSQLDRIPVQARVPVGEYAWSTLARVLVRLKNLEGAEDAIARATEYDAAGPNVGLARLELEYRRGDYQRACEDAKRLLKSQVGEETLYVGDVMCLCALALDKSGRDKEAGEWYEKAVAVYEKLSPEHPELVPVLRAYAGLFEKRGDSSGAARLRARASSIEKRYVSTLPRRPTK